MTIENFVVFLLLGPPFFFGCLLWLRICWATFLHLWRAAGE